MLYDLSIIIPCHNLENYIKPMLNSLNNQNIKTFSIEIFFICDNCTDQTRKIIEHYLPFKPAFKAIHIIDVEYGLAGKTRNVGLSQAQGKYIMFLDGDDWLISQEAFAICIEQLNAHPDCDFVRFKFNYPTTFNYEQRTPRAQMNTVWQFCFRNELIKELRFPLIQPHEDSFFMESVLNNTKKYLNINNILYYYNYGRENSTMYNYEIKK